jgi:hypothetical protein
MSTCDVWHVGSLGRSRRQCGTLPLGLSPRNRAARAIAVGKTSQSVYKPSDKAGECQAMAETDEVPGLPKVKGRVRM